MKSVDGNKSVVRNISEGTVPVSLMANTANGYTINVDLICNPLEETFKKWQIGTFELIAGAYFAMKSAYHNEIAAKEVQKGGIVDANSPEKNKEIVKEELKKQIIGMLTESTFGGNNPVTWDIDSDKPPQIDLSLAVSSAPKIQFLEQAFEWENLTYILYPYYWADPSRWTDLEPIEGTDPDFARFLRSGSARVVVPARKGFEHHVQLFLWLGIIWSGGSVPAAGDETYLSIADEIKAMQRGADDGVPIDSWEVRLPTTLVWLENETGLPHNQHTTIEYPFNAETPMQKIQKTITLVQGMISSNIINHERGTALITKLNDIIKNMNCGNIKSAINELNIFVDQIEGYIDNGKLLSIEGQTLIVSATAAVDSLIAK